MDNIVKHILKGKKKVREVLPILGKLGLDAILFLVDEHGMLIGSLTDGDIRRGLIKGVSLEEDVKKIVNSAPKFFERDNFSFNLLQSYREKNYKIVPVVDANRRIVDIVNFGHQRSYLPIDAVIMAGGKGMRLRPLTLSTPKPLLNVGDKPILEYNIDHLNNYGIKRLTISLNYLGDQIIAKFGSGDDKNMHIQYVMEEQPLGTIAAVRMIKEITNDYVLVMNSDLLTNIDLENMFREFIDQQGDIIMATIPYEVKIPYGIIETEDVQIVGLKEKPTYTYYSNAGIYIFKRDCINHIPKEDSYNATDLVELMIQKGRRVLHYPIRGYWLDIGKPNDFEKAQRDIKHIKF